MRIVNVCSLLTRRAFAVAGRQAVVVDARRKPRQFERHGRRAEAPPSSPSSRSSRGPETGCRRQDRIRVSSAWRGRRGPRSLDLSGVRRARATARQNVRGEPIDRRRPCFFELETSTWSEAASVTSTAPGRSYTADTRGFAQPRSGEALDQRARGRELGDRAAGGRVATGIRRRRRRSVHRPCSPRRLRC